MYIAFIYKYLGIQLINKGFEKIYLPMNIMCYGFTNDCNRETQNKINIHSNPIE